MGREARTIGQSLGGSTTKIDALTDVVSRLYALLLTPSNASNIKIATALCESAGRIRFLLGDQGYDADSLRRSIGEAGAIPVIPGRRNRKRAIRYDKKRTAAATPTTTFFRKP